MNKTGKIKISDILSTTVFTVRPEDKIAEIAACMSTMNIGSALVTDLQNNVLGIVTERDFLHLAGGKYGKITDQDSVEKIMTKNPITMDVMCTLEEVGAIMEAKNFRHMPITQDEKLVGILSARDIFNAFHNQDLIQIKQLEAIRMLAVTYAHEINNPLSVVAFSLNSIGKQFCANKLDRAKQNVSRIGSVIKKISELDSIQEAEYAEQSQLLDLKHAK